MTRRKHRNTRRNKAAQISMNQDYWLMALGMVVMVLGVVCITLISI